MTASGNQREKRIRKLKTYDDNYVLFNISAQVTNRNNNSKYTPKSVTQKRDTSTIENVAQSNTFKHNPGDIVWAKVSGHPWWPCMISNASGASHYKHAGLNRIKLVFYVEFFGPSSEHAWIPEGCLIEYAGIDAFKKHAQTQVDLAANKSSKDKLAERFQLKVALNRKQQWEQAVKEADQLLKQSLQDRHEFFTKKLSSNQSWIDFFFQIKRKFIFKF